MQLSNLRFGGVWKAVSVNNQILQFYCYQCFRKLCTEMPAFVCITNKYTPRPRNSTFIPISQLLAIRFLQAIFRPRVSKISTLRTGFGELIVTVPLKTDKRTFGVLWTIFLSIIEFWEQNSPDSTKALHSTSPSMTTSLSATAIS